MDDADRAQLVIERQLAADLDRAASLARAALGHPATSTHCVECGGEIESPRVLLGLDKCYACAEWLERWSQRW